MILRGPLILVDEAAEDRPTLDPFPGKVGDRVVGPGRAELETAEVLLGEPGDRDKKFRIARRVSYFICGWLEGSYQAGGRPACPLLALPLRARGEPSPDLERLIADISAGKIRPCTQFFDVVGLYDARNQIVQN